ncbi:MAG: polyprenyl synthetase family protein [candidate division WOR-3 bacterium]|nr:MAG: polyprenyl synthetase family protein [candidate division WOR-3 bacterium]
MRDNLKVILKPLSSEMKAIETVINRNTSVVQPPLDSMLCCSMAGGKKLRPALIVLIGRLFKSNRRRIHILAAAIEVLHSATLIHDDLIDDSSLRRGHRTLNAKWPPGATVLAGDYLLARSVSLVAGLGEPRLLSILADALHTMSQGEIRYHYSGECKREKAVYFRSIESKTAALFSAAARMTGVLAGRSRREMDILSLYGREFGIAYQIVDDILDITEAESRLGKPAGSDLAQGTITLPVIYYIERGNEDNLINKILSGRGTAGDTRKVIRLIRKSGAIADALREAGLHARKAKRALSKLPGGAANESLRDLIDYIIARKH